MSQRLKVLCVVALMLAAAAAAAQAPAATPQTSTMITNLRERVAGPTESDLNCSGFISPQSYADPARIAGGWNSPNTSRFADRDFIYITGGSLQQGQEYSVIRHLRDPNYAEAFHGQHGAIAALGSPFAELGRIRVTGHTGKMTIAQVESSCDYMVAGDAVVPLIVHPALQFWPKMPFDRFAPVSGKTQGRVVMAKDFDFFVGDGQKVYLDVGADKGVKPGDYFRAVRSGDDLRRTPVDYLSSKASINEDTQGDVIPPSLGNPADFPRRALAEMIVLSVNAKSSTAMITSALEDVHVGDGVEMEEPPPPAPAAVAPAPTPHPPTLACAAQPMTVRAGDSATITCQAASPDHREINVAFTSDRGRVRSRGNVATLDTANLGPGPVTVTATASDDRNLTASATAMVNVEAPPPPPAAARASEVQFKPRGTYVDNRAKAVLDDVALRLQREADARALVKGYGAVDTPAGTRIATARANHVKTYLTRDKGIDPKRVDTATAHGGDTAEIWLVPAGAPMPR